MLPVLKVSARSAPRAVAGAVAHSVRQQGTAQLVAIGPEAVNQAVKAIVLARGYLATDGIDVVMVPAFTRLQLSNEERTAMVFTVRPREKK
ncbi:MAG: stage V sporulation protein S [Armatimonadetes bacterium]|nr:stage V sporulation protein S [Armatimonadota bacterium]